MNERKPSAGKHLVQLAELLVAHPTVVLSGERMAEELGVSRSSVWRGIEQLRRLGVRLRGHRASGYQLESMPDLLLPALVAPHRKSGALGRRVHYAFRLASTQDAALRAAVAGEPHGSLFLAEAQTAGRGRQGRAWSSPPGLGIYASLLLRPPGPPSGLLAFTLGVAAGVADAVEALTGLRAELRWPNDLLLEGKKFCGLLLEMSGEATRVQHAALGMGINVNQEEFPTELAATATSLRVAGGHAQSRLLLLAEMLRQIELRYDTFAGGGGAELLAEFERRSAYARALRVRVGEGEASYTGVTEGLDGLGFLRVRRADTGALALVISGDVRPLEPLAPPASFLAPR